MSEIFDPPSEILKHAFPDGGGNITVALNRLDDGTIALVVSDDGAGYDVPDVSKKKAGLGTALIDGLVSQLKATINVRRANGTVSEVFFARYEAV